MPGYSFVIAWTVASLGDAAAFTGEARRARTKFLTASIARES
jgi:hypothetical protein